MGVIVRVNANLQDQNDKNDNWPNLKGVIIICLKFLLKNV